MRIVPAWEMVSGEWRTNGAELGDEEEEVSRRRRDGFPRLEIV